MKLPLNFGELDWSDWVLGLWSAVVSGGAAAVYNSVGLIIIDPKDFDIWHSKLWIMALGMFIWAGFIGMMNFLRTKPAPTVKTTTSSMQKTETKPSGATVETKIESKVVEPVPVAPADPKEKQ